MRNIFIKNYPNFLKKCFFNCIFVNVIRYTGKLQLNKEPVKLIKRVKIAYSFLQSVSNQFHVIILSMPM